VGSCDCGDEPSGFDATQLMSVTQENITDLGKTENNRQLNQFAYTKT
jgi:hypothetical protein